MEFRSNRFRLDNNLHLRLLFLYDRIGDEPTSNNFPHFLASSCESTGYRAIIKRNPKKLDNYKM